METLRKLVGKQANTNGTSLKGHLYEVNYLTLVKTFGKPTYPEESADGKVQVEWVFDYNGEVFTLYDWKTYDREYTINQNTRWNVGGKEKSSVAGFLDMVVSMIKQETGVRAVDLMR